MRGFMNDTPEKSGKEAVSAVRRGGAAKWIALLLAIAGALMAIVFSLGRWLVMQDQLQKADAIVLLSGSMPQRALGAAELYRQGYAPEVWVTRPTGPGATLREMGIDFEGEESYNAKILAHEGVAASAIHVLEPEIVNTADEMQAIAAALAVEKGSRVIIVTSKAHTRRVHALWKRFAKPGQTAIVRASPYDPYDPAHWWRSTNDALDTVREVLGLLNAWAGLPLAPSTTAK